MRWKSPMSQKRFFLSPHDPTAGPTSSSSPEMSDVVCEERQQELVDQVEFLAAYLTETSLEDLDASAKEAP